MSTTLKKFGLDQLSVDERIVLVEELWDGIAECPEAVPLAEPQEDDLRRRIDARRDDPKAGSPWEEVKTQLKGTSS